MASSEIAVLVLPADRKKYKTVHEVAAELKRTPGTVKKWIRAGLVDGPSHYEETEGGFTWLYNASDVARLRKFCVGRRPGQKKQQKSIAANAQVSA